MSKFTLDEYINENETDIEEFSEMLECILRDTFPVNVSCIGRTAHKTRIKVGLLDFVFMFTGKNQLRVCLKHKANLVGFLTLKNISNWRDSESKILHVIAEVINFNFGTTLTKKEQGISLTFKR